jgi:hypothetical protein
MRAFSPFLMLCLLLLPAASTPNVTAQGAPGADPDRLLNCLIDGHVPEQPGIAQQGGYHVEFQSLRGVTADDRACTVYRLRNAPDKPPTPLRWTLGDETVVDKLRLPRCGGPEDCGWLSFAKYFPGGIDTNLSLLSYGLNADAYQETAETFMHTVGLPDSDVAEAEGVLASSVGTEIQGTFVGGDDAPRPLHLIVKSRFQEAPAGGSLLVYEIDDLAGSGALTSGALRIEWGALEALSVAIVVEDGEATDGDPVAGAEVARSADRLEVVVPADAFVLDETFVLRVFAAGDAEPLLVVDMPAYVPSAER